MAEAAPDRDPDDSSGKGGTSGQSPADSGSVAVAAPPAAAAGTGGIQLPVWTKVLGWCGIAGLIYLLISAVSIISRGFAGLGGDAAHSMFAFAENPWVGLSVGVLGTVLIQSSTTTTAIAVTAVGSGALPIRTLIPIILGANVGTTVTTTLVALTFIGSRTEFRRALAASTIHDFYNLLALLIFFPLELIWHPLERISGALTSALCGTGWLPDTGPAPGAAVLRRNPRPHRGRAQVGRRRLPHHRLHRAARSGHHPGRRALKLVQAERRDCTIASWAAFTGESGGFPVSTRTTSCAAKSRTVRIASSE